MGTVVGNQNWTPTTLTPANIDPNGAYLNAKKPLNSIARYGYDIVTELDVSSLAFFRLFFNDQIMNKFVGNAYLYGARKHQASWTEVTAGEMFKVFAIIMFMGTGKLP